jgi:hypothetical protein
MLKNAESALTQTESLLVRKLFWALGILSAFTHSRSISSGKTETP